MLQSSVRTTVDQFTGNFRDLVIAAEGRERVDLATLAPQLYAEATKGDEAFGVKFPAEQVIFWEIAVLIGVQLYMFMYLKQLFPQIEE
jgi:hypothetical protein